MNEKSVEAQAAQIDQEIKAVMEKTDEQAAQVDMEQVLQKGKQTAQELQQSTEDSSIHS